MHACGHDVHLAALVAVGRAAARIGVDVPMLMLLQPREEAAPSGAADIVDSGLLAAERVRAVIAAHVQPRVAAASSPSRRARSTPPPTSSRSPSPVAAGTPAIRTPPATLCSRCARPW